MSREKDPSLERAVLRLMQEDEEVMRRKSTIRQATDIREERKNRIMVELRGEYVNERIARTPGSASSGPPVSGEGAAREENIADRPEVGAGLGEWKGARCSEPPEEPRTAKTWKRDAVEREEGAYRHEGRQR